MPGGGRVRVTCSSGILSFPRRRDASQAVWRDWHGFGAAEWILAIRAAGGLVSYIQSRCPERRDIAHARLPSGRVHAVGRAYSAGWICSGGRGLVRRLTTRARPWAGWFALAGEAVRVVPRSTRLDSGELSGDTYAGRCPRALDRMCDLEPCGRINYRTGDQDLLALAAS